MIIAIPKGVPIEQVIALAEKVSDAIDLIFANLENWMPEEMIVLFARAVEGIVDQHPELRSFAISQLSGALHAIQTGKREGD
jgi:trans-aconitate methyltransferase